MTVREAVNELNKAVKKGRGIQPGMYGAVVLLIGEESELFSMDDLDRLDQLRGEKLNIANAAAWKPEEITREDAELIRRGLSIYRDVLWELHGKEIIAKIAQAIQNGGLNNES